MDQARSELTLRLMQGVQQAAQGPVLPGRLFTDDEPVWPFRPFLPIQRVKVDATYGLSHLPRNLSYNSNSSKINTTTTAKPDNHNETGCGVAAYLRDHAFMTIKQSPKTQGFWVSCRKQVVYLVVGQVFNIPSKFRLL